MFSVTIETDGYGKANKYFRKKESAMKFVRNFAGLYYDKDSNKYYIDGMKDTCVSEDESSFSLYGVQYPQEEWTQFAIGYYRVNVCYEDFEPKASQFVALMYAYGYASWLDASMDGKETPDNYVIRYFDTKDDALLWAKDDKDKREAWNKEVEEKGKVDKFYSIFNPPKNILPRSWEVDCSPYGETSDYMSLVNLNCIEA